MTNKDIKQFLKISKLFGSNKLSKPLKPVLKKKLDPKNVCFFYQVMKNNSRKDTYILISNYLQKYFVLVTENNYHMEFNFDFIKAVISCPKLKITSEIEVFNAAEAWVVYDIEERSRFALELLKGVCLPLLSLSALKSLIDRDSGFTKCSDCFRYIQNEINIKEKRSVRQASTVVQNRHCEQDSFHTIVYSPKGTKRKSTNTYEIYQLEDDNFVKTAQVQQRNRRFDKFLFISGTLYFLSSIEIMSYSTFTKEWKRLAKFLIRRTNYCACDFMGDIYILGGFCTYNSLVFEPKTNNIKEIAHFEQDKTDPACVVHYGRIIVSGGTGNSWNTERTVRIYDHVTEQWSYLPNMLVKRHRHVSLSVNNKLYMLGGYYNNTCEVLESGSKVFVFIKSMSSFNSLDRLKQCYNHYVVLGNKIVVINQFSLDAAVFDVESEEWAEVEDFRNIKSIQDAHGNLTIPKY